MGLSGDEPVGNPALSQSPEACRGSAARRSKGYFALSTWNQRDITIPGRPLTTVTRLRIPYTLPINYSLRQFNSARYPPRTSLLVEACAPPPRGETSLEFGSSSVNSSEVSPLG